MFASHIARWLTRHRIHYGWFMVAITFVTTVCSSAALSLAGILVLPLVQEFHWGRADIAAVMGLMLLLFAGMAPFAGALMLRYGLCRTVVVAIAMTLLGLVVTARMATLWQFAAGFGVLLGTAAGAYGVNTESLMNMTCHPFVRRRIRCAAGGDFSGASRTIASDYPLTTIRRSAAVHSVRRPCNPS